MLKGDLTTTPIDSVLADLANEEATGCLHVIDDDGEEALVYLKSGLVYAVSVPGQRPALGARLISSNALVPENLAEALEAQRTELQGWRLGELLVHLGFVEQDVVEAFVQEQVRDGFTDLMTWRTGRWRFRKGEKTREDVAPPTPLTTLLDLVHARQATWDEIVASVHGPNAVPMLAARGGEADVVLDSDTWSLLCKIDGERSLAELARECGFTLFEAGNVVRALVEAGLVDVEEDLGPDSDPVSPVSAVADLSVDRADDVDADVVEVVDVVADDASDAEFARTAALAAAFALGKSDSDDENQVDEHADVASSDDADAAEPDAVANAVVDAFTDAVPETGSEMSASENPEVPALMRVSDAFAKAFTPPTDPASFVDPFHVPDEIRLRPSPKRGDGPTAPSEEDQRRERIRRAAAAELAAAHAEAEAMRKGQTGASGHIADVVNLEARREAARVEAERRKAERLEAERLEAERLEAERLEAERLEAERLEAERLEAERLEAERLEAERLEAERLEAERLEAERLEAERLEAERLEAERLEAERLEAERLEAERLEAERLEAERLEAERLEAKRLEAERLEAERLETERLEAERLEAERLEAERLEAERLEAERLEAERLAAERAEAQRILAAEQLMAAQAAEAAAAEAAAAEAAAARAAAEEAAAEESARLAAVDPGHLASASAMLAEFSRTGATTLTQQEAEAELAQDEEDEADDALPQPIVQRDLTDTASLLRELSSLGFEDEPSNPPPVRPAPSAPRPVSGSAPKKKRGLFGR